MTAIKRTTDEALCRMAARLRLVYTRDHMVEMMSTATDAPRARKRTANRTNANAVRMSANA